MRSDRPFYFTNLKTGDGVSKIANFIVDLGGLERWPLGIIAANKGE
jgi:hypothetical protein